MNITQTEIDQITNAATWEDASSIAGSISDAHYAKLDYIKSILGYRTVGGFFNPTVANVNKKFKTAWETANAASTL